MKKNNILSVAIAATTLLSAANVFATETEKAAANPTTQVAEEVTPEEVKPEAEKEAAK